MPPAPDLSPVPLRLLRLIRLALHLFRGLLRVSVGFPRWSSARREHEIRRWSRDLFALLAIRLDVPHAPAPAPGGTMFVLNHVSWLDIFLLDAVLPVTFVAKSEIGNWPLVGTLVTRAGTLYIERGSKSAARRTSERVAEALRDERPIAIFPEGTTSHGESVQRFHAALFQPAIDTSSTIVPVALRYSDTHGHLTHAASYVGDDSLLKSVWMIVSQRRMSARLEFLGAISAQGGDRRALAEQSRAEIAAALENPGSGIHARAQVKP